MIDLRLGDCAKYLTIYADPPWCQGMTGGWKRRPNRASDLPYQTMTSNDIKALPVGDLAETGCHLWLWTTNQFLRDGFDVMQSWGFTYLAPITWVKPSGLGNYFIHRTQTLLFGYKNKCRFEKARFKPTVLFAGLPKRHSEKPLEAYELIESVSKEPRLELFCRKRRDGWDAWGNEVESSFAIAEAQKQTVML